MSPYRNCRDRLPYTVSRAPMARYRSCANITKGPGLGLKILFGVDYTLPAMDGSLRPMTRQTFEKLIDIGHEVFIWSGVGGWTSDVKRHDLQDLFPGV